MKLSKNNRKAGFTLVEIMIVVAIIGLLAAIAIPNFVRARTTAQANACINNLRQYNGAAQQWALETKAAQDSPVSADNIMPYVKLDATQQLPKCPGGGDYQWGNLSDEVGPVTCSKSSDPIPHAMP